MRALNRVLPLLLLPLIAGFAQGESVASPGQPSAVARGAWDSADMRAFLDQVLQEEMAAHHIPGAAAVAVHHGEVIYLAGHGHADAAGERAVDPHATLFPQGSISKLFTTIAVLQLQEAGKLDVQADVQSYIEPLEVDRRFAAPITLAHLLTHTDGLDPRWLFGGAVADPAALPKLADVLSPLPPRIFPPGELYVYSDVGMALAGYVVERVAEQPLPSYLEQKILAPLGMHRSRFQQPLPAELAADLATGHEDRYDGSGRNRAVPTVYPIAPAASGLVAPIADLGPVLQTLLADGVTPTGERLLSPSSVDRILRRQFSHHDALPGITYGMYEYERNGRRAILHGGLSVGFTTLLLVVPEEDFGLAVALNKYGLVTLLESQLLQRVFDAFFPAPAEPPTAPVAGVTRADGPSRRSLVGRYRSDQYSRASIDKLALVAGVAPEFEVVENADGSLQFIPGEGTWTEIGPELFRNEDTGERVAFRLDASGRAARIVGSAHFMSYHRLAWWERLPSQAALWSAFLVLLGLFGLAVLACAVRRGNPFTALPGRLWLARAGAGLTVLLPFLAVAAVWTGIQQLDVASAFLGLPSRVVFALFLPTLFTLTAVLTLVVALLTPSEVWPRSGERWLHVGIGILVLLFTPVLFYWNLLPPPGLL